jgi:Helix-turn-helix domain
MLVTMEEMQEDQLSVEAAGKIVGISPRTLRTWIVHGKLPAVGGRRGKLVRLADVIAVANALETDQPVPQPVERWGDDFPGDNVAPARMSNPIVDSMLAELRDGVIWPLAERLEVLAQENGRLAAERDAAVQARDELAGRFGSDHRFVDRLVELLQADLDRANQRIAELETDVSRLASRCARAEADLNPAAKALLRLRKFR